MIDIASLIILAQELIYWPTLGNLHFARPFSPEIYAQVERSASVFGTKQRHYYSRLDI
jgi:hypothetical protein